MVCAAALTACGGGGGGSTPPPAGGGTVNVPVATDLQAKTLAARSADALFAYDHMNSEVFTLALATLPLGVGFGTGNYGATCQSGSGSIAYNDADASGTISVGDVATLTATACQTTGTNWLLGGTMPVSVTAGSNVQQHLFALSPGSARLTVAHTGSTIGGNRTATGGYQINVSNTLDGASPDQAITIADLTIAHASANVRMVGVTYTVTASTSLNTASGNFETSVAGIGNVTMALSVKSPLGIDASTSRFRPSNGTLTLTGSNFSMDVVYGIGGAITIRVDNGKDGTVDRTVTTTETELDSLLTTP
jgi:hypothetical protein